MQHTDIDNDELVKMYNVGTSIPELMAQFKTGHTVLYNHLKKAGTSVNRRSSSAWTPEEEAQLIAAWAGGATGQDYTDRVPTRTLASCKCHLVKLRRDGRLVR